MVWMLISFIFTSPCFPIPLSLPTDSQSHILSVLSFFDPWWRRRSKLPYSWEFIQDLFLVSIYRDDFLSCIIEHRTTLPCYCPIFFTLYLSQSETESSLLLVLKGCFLWLIFRLIKTYFHIHSPFFISWKQNIIFFCPTCCRWSDDLFDMNLVK